YGRRAGIDFVSLRRTGAHRLSPTGVLPHAFRLLSNPFFQGSHPALLTITKSLHEGGLLLW
ncbi:MAG: hypothetical protein J6B00_02655, partial [Alphaproteobacteria bacterium]|nr:hypothetical protein [Alphaproteobacteria bacterium]